MAKEYIEREAATAVIEEKQKELCPVGMYSRHAVYGSDREKFDAWQEIIDALEAIPAADVRPVVRGEWSVQEIYKHEMSYGTTAYEPVYKCSACGNLMESYLRYDEPIMPEDADFPRFCPNCGADMREES